MATKRMFSNSVIDSDAFCMLSVEAQLLYFHLGMKADDDGFVPVMKISRILGFDEKPLQELEKAGFLIAFENGVVVIVHWKVNNTLKQDRYHESRYSSYKKRLKLNENGEYSIMEPEWNQVGANSEDRKAQGSPAQENPGKGSPAQVIIGEGSAEGGGDLQKVIEAAERQGVKMTEAVKRILAEEIEKSTVSETISKLIVQPNFLQRLKMVGGTA